MRNENQDWGEFEATARRLAAADVDPTGVELDRALDSARRRAASSRSRSQHGGFMRSKVAIVAVLAAGLVTSGAGTTLAFQGGSGKGSASTAQYGPSVSPGQGEGNNGNPGPPNNPGVNNPGPNNGENNPPPTIAPSPGNSGPKGTTSSQPEAQVQRPRQVAATSGNGSSLPFTGLAALPIIAIGLVLLITGVALQRRSSRDPA